MQHSSKCQEVKKLRKAATKQGWSCSTTQKGHTRFTPPDPSLPIVIYSGSAGDHRAIKNFVARLRNSGLVIK